MKALLDGIQTFHDTYYPSQRQLFENLAEGQQPTALFITCSDSRVNPNLLTQTRPGEMFVLRNAGNIVPPYDAKDGGESATIEYAVSVLNVKDIIICGHSNCGAVKALVAGHHLDELPAIAAWLAHAEVSPKGATHASSHKDELTAGIERNVVAQLANLRTHPAVARKLERGALALHGWVYQIGAGTVSGYEQHSEKFVSLIKQMSDVRC